MALPTMRAGIIGREFLRIAGGFGSAALGKSPAGGLDIDNAGNLATDGDVTAKSITVENDVQQWSVEARADDGDKFIIRDATNGQDVIEILPNAGNERMQMTAGETVFNQDGLDVNHRIEGQNDTNLFFCDAGNDRIGIGTNAPGEKLQLSTNANETITVEVKCTNTGASSVGQLKATANGGSLQILMHGTGRTATRYGISLGDIAEILANGASGLLIGSQEAIDIVFGTSATERMRIDSAGKVGIGGSPATDVLLDLNSTTAAFRPPSMTTAQRDALSASGGMMIYNTTTNTMQFYNGSAWATL